MTPEEIITSPEEEVIPVKADAVLPDTADAAEELTQLLTDPAQEEPAEPEAEAEPEVPEEPVTVTEKKKKTRRKPHIALRIPLQLLSFVLAVALFAVSLAGALILDVGQITSAGGIKQIIDAVISTMTTSAPAKTAAQPHLEQLSNWTVRFDETDPSNPMSSYTVIVDENGNTVVIDENGNVVDMDPSLILGSSETLPDINLDELPEDILTGGDSEENMGDLIDWIYDQVEQATGEELEVDKEQVQNFVEQSTVGDYLSEKLAGFAEDYINGTENTVITAEEIMDLIEENEELLKSELQVEITPEIKTELKQNVDKFVVENDINKVIREEVFTAVDDAIQESTDELGVDMEQIRSALQLLASDSMRNFIILVVAVMILLLCLLNFYNIPAGLTWAAIPLLLSGGVLQALLAAVNIAQSQMDKSVAQLLQSFAGVFQPVHNAVLYLGVGLLVVSIVWRIIRAIIRNARANA